MIVSAGKGSVVSHLPLGVWPVTVAIPLTTKAIASRTAPVPPDTSGMTLDNLGITAALAHKLEE